MSTAHAAGRHPPTTCVGRHYIVELHGCDPDRLRYADDLREVLLHAAEEASATVVGFAFHQFRPEGASGVLLIAESHVALHTWPEHAYMAMDVFTCGEEMDPELAIDIVKEGVDADHVRVRTLERGF